MTHPLYVAEELVLAQRDREEAWWMWRSFGYALTAKHAQDVSRNLYAAFVAYRAMSFGMQELFAGAFRQAYAAGVARAKMLEHEAELDYARRMVGECEAEVARCAGEPGLVGSHLSALEGFARWRRRLEALEGRTG